MKKIVLLSAFGALLPLLPAHAVVLEQKWKAGQQLSYATTLSGTANVRVPATANFPLAGVPLEVPIKGAGVFQMQTTAVDAAGVGTITVRVPQFNLSGQAFGQMGQLTLQEATSRITLNGRPIKVGDGTNPLAQPQFSLQVSPQGRLVGYQPLGAQTAPPAAQTPAAQTPAVETPAAQTPVNPAQAANGPASMIASVLRALPTLWPGRDVQVGDTWKAEIALPTAPAATAPNATAPDATTPNPAPAASLGTWNMTFKGTETVDGKVLQRVGVIGKIAFDSAQLPTTTRLPLGAGGSATQDVRGDLWLDAGAGQIARANLLLGVQAEGGQVNADKMKVSFVGTLQMNLKDN